MSRTEAELGRIKTILRRVFPDPERRALIEGALYEDIERGTAELIIVGNETQERIYFLVKTLELPQKRSVKVIFQTMAEKDNQELLHLLYRQTRE